MNTHFEAGEVGEADEARSGTGAEVRSARRTDGGFTLVELLIVIAILGILSTVSVLAVRGVSNRGQDQVCKTNRNIVQTAAEAYYATNAAYPQAVAASGSGATAVAAKTALQVLRDAGYLSPSTDVSATGILHDINSDGTVVGKNTCLNK